MSVATKPWEPEVDPNSVRMYPGDPVKELRRIRRRVVRMSNGFGTFSNGDIKVMEEVQAEIRKKLERLTFLEGKLKEMTT